MKKLITVEVIKKSADQGIYSIVYDKNNSIITPEAWDIAKLLSVELTQSIELQAVKPQFCGVRPSFSASDQELLIHTIKHKVREKLNHLAITDDELTQIIEEVLSKK